MANKHKKIEPTELLNLAQEYCDECMEHKKDHVAGSGKVVPVEDRKIPTVKYFVMHWLRKRKLDFYTREYVYEAMRDEAHPLSYTLKTIREYFDSLAEDIVANEGKGIFYAKNRLGMHDKQHIENKNVDKFDFDE